MGASDIFYSNNPTDWTALEGLYVSPQPPTAMVRDVDLDVVGLVGKCVRGPAGPLEVGDVASFLRTYGGRGIVKGGTLLGEVWKALQSKPFGRLFVRRVIADDADAATKQFSSSTTAILRLDASSPGLWGSSVQAAVEAASDGDATHFNLRLSYQGKQVLYANLNCSVGSDNLAATLGDDPGNLVVATKLADGRPLNASLAALTGGSEGALAATDYTAAVEDMANTDGPGVVLVPEACPDMAVLHAKYVELAPDVHDKVFLAWSGVHGQAVSAEISQKQAQILTAFPNVAWFYNSPQIVDPETGLKVSVGPHTWAASILSQNDINVHVGASATVKQTSGIVGVANPSLGRGDLISLREAGISTMQQKRKGKGFRFRSGVCTDNSELVDERQIQFLILGASEFLEPFVLEPNTHERRGLMAGGLDTYSSKLKKAGRIIADFAVKTDVTTDDERAEGIEKIQWLVRLIGHILFLVFETDISTGTVILTGTATAP